VTSIFNDSIKEYSIQSYKLIQLKDQKKIKWCESQSGFDGRILLNKPYLEKLLKNTGFRYPRIAWDWEDRRKGKN